MAVKNRIVVTGLSLFDEAIGGDGCLACDYDVSWLFRYPSTLLWADEIIVSPKIHKLVQQGITPKTASESWGRIAAVFFEIAEKHKIVKVRDPEGFLSQEMYDAIGRQVDHDRETLKARFPDQTPQDTTKKAPGGFVLNGMHYCNPRIAELYFSLLIARAWEANVLLNPHAENYLKHKYLIQECETPRATGVAEACAKVFSQHLPEVNILPPEAYSKCLQCARLPACSTDTTRKAEKTLREYSEWREYDEVHQMKEVFSSIAKEAGDNPDPVEISKQFEDTRNRLQKRLRAVFPRVERWSHLTTMLSIPVIVAGVTTGAPIAIGMGAGMAGIPQVIKEYVDYARSKARWVGFKQSDD